MKIKTAVNALLSDKATGLGSKMEVIAFLRRYSLSTRPVTHYSCMGKATDDLKRLLTTMGMEENTDFTVASSSFDDKFNQIRWTRESKKIAQLVMSLGATPLISSMLDDAYADLLHGKFPQALVDSLHDIDWISTTAREPAALDESLLPVKVAKATEKIAKAVMNLDENCGKASKVKNLKVAMRYAKRYLENRFDKDGKPLPNAPYVLPLAILELYVKAVPGVKDVANKVCGLSNSIVFKATERAYDMFRLCRYEDRLIWNACLGAPLKFLWDAIVPEGCPDNPLHGYYVRDMNTALAGRLDDKIGVFVGGNAELIHDADADDNLTPALCVSNHTAFWEYVLNIYRAAYGLDSGLSCQSRIGVSTHLPVWGRDSAPECRDGVEVYEEKFIEDTKSDGGAPIMAMYGCLLGDEIERSFSNVYSFISQDRKPIELMLTKDKKVPDFSGKHLVRDEMAWEWFAMTHLDEDAGTCLNNTHVYMRPKNEDDDEQLVSSIQKLKKLASSSSEKDIAQMSMLMHNNCFTKQYNERSIYDRYTPLSAFVEGLCVAIRKTCCPDGMRNSIAKFLKPRADKSRPADLIITNIYSGLVTSQSPALGSEQDVGAVFPDPCSGSSDVPPGSPEDKARFTAFLDRLNSGKTFEQVNFARRKAGESGRRYILVVETNMDAEKILGARSNIFRDVGTVFLQNLVIGRGQPGCIINEETLQEANGATQYSHDENLRSYTSKYVSYLFGDRSFYRLPAGVYNPGGYPGLVVSERQDVDGRLVFLFDMSGDMATYARLVFRLRCGFPLMTAYVKEKTFSGFSDNELCIVPSDWPSVDIANNIVCKYMTNGCPDYHGTEDIRMTGSHSGEAGPLFRGTVAYRGDPFICPDREWFLSRSTEIGCSAVFEM